MWFYFIGFLFVFLDFDIPLAYGGSLNAMPDFLGYALLLLASRFWQYENEHFRRSRIATLVVFCVSPAEFVLSLTALTLPTPLKLVLSLLMTAGALYVSYEFAEGAKALEQNQYKRLEADKLGSAWFILAASSLLRIVAFYFPSVALTSEVLHLIAVIWFSTATYGFLKHLKRG